MQSTRQYQPHALSTLFLEQYNQDKEKLKQAYYNALHQIQCLRLRYEKAFDPFSPQAFGCDVKLFAAKQAIAEKIVADADQLIDEHEDPYQFLVQIDLIKVQLEKASKANRENDPAFFFDSVFGKVAGGQLGVQLDALQNKINDVSYQKEKFISNFVSLCKNRLHYLYSARALVREKLIALEQTDQGTSNIRALPFQEHKEYHFAKAVDELSKSIDDQALVEFVTENILQFNFTSFGLQKIVDKTLWHQLTALDDQCGQMINDIKLILFEISAGDPEFNRSGKVIDRSKLAGLVKDFLLIDFAYSLPFKEKEYWWRLIVQAHELGRGPKASEVTVAKHCHFIFHDEFWEFLLTAYSSNPTIYAGSPTLEMLKNWQLNLWLKEESVDDSAGLIKSLVEAVERHDIPLNRTLAKEGTSIWKNIHNCYEKCNWKEVIQYEFMKEVIEPFQLIDAFTRDEALSKKHEGSYYGQLFVRAEAFVNAFSDNYDGNINKKSAILTPT